MALSRNLKLILLTIPLQIVKLLARHRADLKKPSSNGETPLLLAARNGHMEVVEFLYERGVLS